MVEKKTSSPFIKKKIDRKKSKSTVETQAGINGMCCKNRDVSNKS